MKLLIAFVLVGLVACTGMSLEQRAETAYGSYVAVEKTAAEAIQSPEVSDQTKLRIQQAARNAKPVADALLVALVSFRKNRNDSDELHRALMIAEPTLAAFAAEVP